ncbi:hypothetical protein IWQ62_002846 [Dispira parvispora]|uniref:Uncharacterized protein n=1 Tax=Dispira parvispora TaxID=1520584 RepID=A0A9W8AVX7_9FUNG|nr:hypothetical protein IWQ62_002846 [Dispira parvispora]
MAFKLFLAIALGALATTATAEIPSDVVDCVADCPSAHDNNCAANCTGIPAEVLENLGSCAYNCVTAKSNNPRALVKCISGCINDFNSQSPYSYGELIDAMFDILEDSIPDTNDVDDNTYWTGKNVTRNDTNVGTQQ